MRCIASFMMISRVSKHHGYVRRSRYMPLHDLLTKSHYCTAAAEKAVRFKVTVTSREMIKPSSPTPPHFKTLHLSLLDQLASSFRTPILLFYQNETNNNNNNNNLTNNNLLKKSLSDILVDFYPLAGRIQGNASIDCNDEGVEFSVAYVSDSLKEVVEDPKPDELEMLCPFEVVPPQYESSVLSVQVNHFCCGGMAIGLRISHKIADAASFTDFLNAWANVARGRADLNILPVFIGASVFPPLEELNAKICSDDQAHVGKERIASKRLVFNKKDINELKRHQASTSSLGYPVSGDERSLLVTKDPTRVELVYAFILKRMLETGACKPDFTKISTVGVPLNLRTKVVQPPIPEGSFGNFVWVQSTSHMSLSDTLPRDNNNNNNNNNVGRHTSTYPMLVNEFRKTIKKMDKSYTRPLMRRGDRSVSEVKRMEDDLSHGPDKCIFTSLCSYSLYEVNFGVGRPVWVHVTPSAKNVVVLWGTRCGQGVEAWIHMLQDDITMLDLDFDHRAETPSSFV